MLYEECTAGMRSIFTTYSCILQTLRATEYSYKTILLLWGASYGEEIKKKYKKTLSKFASYNSPSSPKVGQYQGNSSFGSYHFLPGGGDHLFVMAGRKLFMHPPFAFVKIFWSPG